MCVYTHNIHIHVYKCVYTHVRWQRSTRGCTHTHTYTNTHTHTHAHTHAHAHKINVFLHIYIHVCVHILGGNVVHVAAGFSGLVSSLVIGNRKGFGRGVCV